MGQHIGEGNKGEEETDKKEDKTGGEKKKK
jgi:hypothetical protein